MPTWNSLKPVILSLFHGYVLHFIYKLLAVLQEYITTCKSTVLSRQAIEDLKGKWENGSKPAQTSTLTPWDEQLLRHTFQPSRSRGTSILWESPSFPLYLCHGSQSPWITSQHKYPVMAFMDKVAYTELTFPFHSVYQVPKY